MPRKKADNDEKPPRKKKQKLQKCTALVSLRKPPMPEFKLPRESRIDAARAAFLVAYERTCGNITDSCRIAGISRTTFYRWVNSLEPEDLEFQRQLAEIRPLDRLADLAESVVVARLNAFDLDAAKFVLNSHRVAKRGRGFSPRPVVDPNINAEVERTREAIRERAVAKNVRYDQELRFVAQNFAHRIAPGVLDALLSELDDKLR